MRLKIGSVSCTQLHGHIFDGFLSSDCLSSAPLHHMESLCCGPKHFGRLMLRSGYLATVGDQQLDNETLPQTSTQTCILKRKPRPLDRHSQRQQCGTNQLVSSPLRGPEVLMVVMWC